MESCNSKVWDEDICSLDERTLFNPDEAKMTLKNKPGEKWAKMIIYAWISQHETFLRNHISSVPKGDDSHYSLFWSAFAQGTTFHDLVTQRKFNHCKHFSGSIATSLLLTRIKGRLWRMRRVGRDKASSEWWSPLFYSWVINVRQRDGSPDRDATMKGGL